MISRFGMLWMAVIPFAVLSAIVVLCVSVIWRTIKAPRRCAPEPACEKCRYPVAGLAALTCPECGTDLRQTGIITRPMEMRRRGSIVGAIAAWTVVLTLVSYIVGSVVAFSGASYSSTASSTATYTVIPKSGAFKSLEITHDYGGMASSFPFILVQQLNDGTSRKLHINLVGSIYSVRRSDGSEESSGAYDEATIPAWLGNSGLPTDSPSATQEGKDIQRMVDAISVSGWANLNGISFKSITVAGPVFASAPTPVASAIWPVLIPFIVLGIWLMGILAIVLRRRALVREAGRIDRQFATVRSPRAALAATDVSGQLGAHPMAASPNGGELGQVVQLDSSQPPDSPKN